MITSYTVNLTRPPFSIRKLLTALLPPMLEACSKQAQTAERIELALAEELLGAELERLRRLARINLTVRPEEVEALEHEHTALLTVLPQARPRLDAMRLVLSPDVASLRG
jgi:ATP-dependent helicase HepA